MCAYTANKIIGDAADDADINDHGNNTNIKYYQQQKAWL
jgi:hypothetical protein